MLFVEVTGARNLPINIFIKVKGSKLGSIQVVIRGYTRSN